MRAAGWMERSRRERPSLAVPRLPGPGPAPPPGGVPAGTGNRDRNGWRQAGSDRSRGDRRDRPGLGRGGSAAGRPRSGPGFAFGMEIGDRLHRDTGRYRRGNRVGASVSPMRRSGSASRRSGWRGGLGIAETDTARYRSVRLARFIPAWAGNASSTRPCRSPVTVHPRVGGERALKLSQGAGVIGSSPRGRGTLEARGYRGGPHRFIPAWAGNAASAPCCAHLRPVHPRVGGERRAAIQVVRPNLGSSPRGRGTQLVVVIAQPFARFIPAWAGNATPASTATVR